MFTNYVGLSMGNGLAYVKFTIPFGDLTAAATTQDITLLGQTGQQNNVAALPQAGKILGIFVKHSVAFAGPSITALTVSVGKSGSTTFFTAAQDIFQAVADTTVQETALFKSGQLSALNVLARFTATGANLSVLTAGSVDIYVLYINVSTPSA